MKNTKLGTVRVTETLLPTGEPTIDLAFSGHKLIRLRPADARRIVDQIRAAYYRAREKFDRDFSAFFGEE